MLEAVAINLAELRHVEPAAVVFGNLQRDREMWLAKGASMSRAELLRHTKAKVAEVLERM